MKILTRSIATLLVGLSLASHQLPAKATPALVAPVACLTGVGCVLLGTVVISGVVYYVWQNSGGGQVLTPITDSEDADGWELGETAIAMTPRQCLEMAQRYGKRLVKFQQKTDMSGGFYYVCHFK